MDQHVVTFLPDNIQISVNTGTSLLQAEIDAGIIPDAPCGGTGTCGKCRVYTHTHEEILACQTIVNKTMTVYLDGDHPVQILSKGVAVVTKPDGMEKYVLAFDIGTTTVVAYLLDGETGNQIVNSSSINFQNQYGADVISRIQYVLQNGPESMQACIRKILSQLTLETAEKARIHPREITKAVIVGNTAMHHLLLGIDPTSLIIPPYMPSVCQALEMNAEGIIPISGTIYILPNIAGFVGSDTVGCMVATRIDKKNELTLIVDIGTNGEMVLGNCAKRIACSTAAGPAFEGAKISCGMRGAEGAVDHVWLENGELRYHVIGDRAAVGLCGSGLLDLVAVLLDIGVIDESGRMDCRQYRLDDTEVVLTQKDVRELQLAKAAIRAGIELLAQKFNVTADSIQKVYLAGAFGNYLTPSSACRIGMLPPCLEDRIEPIGNAAGEGAKLCALSKEEYLYSQELAKGTEFLELASLPQFQECYIDFLAFSD